MSNESLYKNKILQKLAVSGGKKNEVEEISNNGSIESNKMFKKFLKNRILSLNKQNSFEIWFGFNFQLFFTYFGFIFYLNGVAVEHHITEPLLYTVQCTYTVGVFQYAESESIVPKKH